MKLNSLSLTRNTNLRGSLMAMAVAAAFLATSAMPGSAQILKRGVQGGLLGAGVGAIVGGGKGAGTGAAIGAAVGVVVGAGEKSNAHAHPPPQHHDSYAPAPNYGPTHGLVYNIQSSLHKLGYSPGPIDGRYGQRTSEAIRAYEYDNQLLVTGQPSNSLYQHLVQHGG